MLIFDFTQIGNKLYSFRKKVGMTQAEVAEAAGISDRTYADIERGTVNMRVETLLRICKVLKITPNEALTEEVEETEDSIVEELEKLPLSDKKIILKMLEAYIKNK
ncbi:MAG: helix-turn-helix transcriptional regulator [Clostridia bacterium]|nr:helix-turn-helix transcriptional regulator [Clostridia bacterium]